MFSLTLLAWSLALSTVAAAPCRQDWIYFDGSCYAFGESSVSWPEAQEVCRGAGGKLAEIETTSENEFLKHQATQHNVGHYWIGGTDIFHEGVWTWHSTGELIAFSDWHPGQPNDSQAHEDCMDLEQTFNYQWNDAPCTEELFFICEAAGDEPVVG